MARAIKHIKAGLLNRRIIGTIPEREPGRRRAGRCRPTCAAQQFYNDKCSWRQCELILAANFGRGCSVVTNTYDDAHLPESKEDSAKEWRKYIASLRSAWRLRGKKLKYIYVTEGWHGKAEDEYFGDDGQLEDKRIHHHMVINGASPEDLEAIRSLWRGGGYIRVEPLDVHYYEELAKYLTKEAREFGRPKPGKPAWIGSKGLEKPVVEYEEIHSDGVTLTAPPGAVDYVQFTERNPYGFADCVGDRYLLFEEEPLPQYSYARGRKRNRSNNF